jgi:hypothetical protein
MKIGRAVKSRFILALFFCGMGLLNACKTKGLASFPPADSNPKEKVSITGIIQKQGMTTYQYGTHVLCNKNGKTFYALKSETIRLDDYIGKTVEVQGQLLNEYPVEGGPPYVDVTHIKE